MADGVWPEFNDGSWPECCDGPAFNMTKVLVSCIPILGAVCLKWGSIL